MDGERRVGERLNARDLRELGCRFEHLRAFTSPPSLAAADGLLQRSGLSPPSTRPDLRQRLRFRREVDRVPLLDRSSRSRHEHP